MSIEGSKIFHGDAGKFPRKNESVHAIVTSLPRFDTWQRHLDPQSVQSTVQGYVNRVVETFRNLSRILRRDGTAWIRVATTRDMNKDTLIPQRLSTALADSGWTVNSDICLLNTMATPSSNNDFPAPCHEHVLMLTKNGWGHYYDHLAVMEKGEMEFPKKLTSVWRIPAATQGNKRHQASMSEGWAEFCVLLGTSDGGCCPACGAPYRRIYNVRHVPIGHREGRIITRPINDTTGWMATCNCRAGLPDPCVVLDPFAGSGTVPCVSHRLGRVGIGIEQNREYCEDALNRLSGLLPATIPPKGYLYTSDNCSYRTWAIQGKDPYISTELWARVLPILKQSEVNLAEASELEIDRCALEGILIHLIHEIPWGRLPGDGDIGTVAKQKYQKWVSNGTWQRILLALKDVLPIPDKAKR